MFFEQAREQAEREFKANNKDAMVRRYANPLFLYVNNAYCSTVTTRNNSIDLMEIPVSL